MMFRAYIIIASDSSYQGIRADGSGPEAERLLTVAGYEVTGRIVLPDDRRMLADKMKQVADEGLADLIVTSGGTGFSPRDVTPEATEDVTERAVPGIPEAIRADSMRYTPRAMLSRGTAGIRKRTLIVNLPGSPKAVRETLTFLLEPLEHGLAILTGLTSDCARKENSDGT